MHRQRLTYDLVESDENLYEIDRLWEWWHIGWLPKIVETVKNLFVDAEILPVKEWRYDRYEDVLWFGPEKSRSKIVTRFQPYGRHVSKHNIYHHFDTFQFQYFILYRKANRWYLESGSFSFLERIIPSLLRFNSINFNSSNTI